jgi:cobyrinic acid a,c-diamide synthase
VTSHCPRLLIAADGGSAGKTTLALGLLAAWRALGRSCAAFKKGPDYIDPAWLSLAAGRPCRNLDTYLMGEETALASFARHALSDGLNLIEGNRGLHDGVDARGSYSAAELAKLLASPTVVVIDCTKRTRTAAAVALGCRLLDAEVPVAGFILNRRGSSRQEGVARAAVEQATGLPVFGAVPKIAAPSIAERHLGLIPPQETDATAQALATAAEIVERHLDLDGLWRLAHQAPPLRPPSSSSSSPSSSFSSSPGPRIGYFRDAAFHFYYPENLEALEALGARLAPIDSLRDPALPDDLDGLYIGGGFPEERAATLAANASMRASVRRASDAGLPIYAECGGLIYLGRRVIHRDQSHEMAGVFPVSFEIAARPQGHGYIEAIAGPGHPFLPAGTSVRGHEFHYSRPIEWRDDEIPFALRLTRGHGFSDGRDGLVRRATFAAYAHVHALSETWWAPALVARCARRARP